MKTAYRKLRKGAINAGVNKYNNTFWSYRVKRLDPFYPPVHLFLLIVESVPELLAPLLKRMRDADERN